MENTENKENLSKGIQKRIALFLKGWYNTIMVEQILNVEKYEKIIREEKREEFALFRALLLEYNQKYNLTTILEEEDMFYKHFLDSAVGESLFSLNAKVAEIGSGAGFPSLVLKIIRPDLKLDLFESVRKKCEFLRAVVDKFAFQDVHIYNLRAEDAAKSERFRERYDFATARAVARMNTLCEYCLPFVKVGGAFVAYKSGDEEEIVEAKNACKILGALPPKTYKLELPKGYGKRILAVAEKEEKTPMLYPRGQGKERKQPL